MRSKPAGVALMLLAFSGTAAPQPSSPAIVLRSELFPAEPAVNVERGIAIAYDGDWLAVGARLDDDAGTDAGAVYLFQWDGVRWLERQKLAPAGFAPGEQFGISLALQGGILAVGAIGQDRDDDRPSGGAVYLFTESEGVWEEQSLLTAPPGVRQFGRSIAIDGGALAVGALELEPQGEDELGVVFFFPGSVAPGVPLRPPRRRSVEQDRFGESLALAGGLLAVGAPGDDTVGQNAGVVYVFESSPETGWQTARILAPGSGDDGPAGDQFGAALAVSDGRLAVGAPSAGADRAGAAYVLERSGSSWRPLELSPRSRSPQARFGHAVAMDGRRLAVGAPFASAGMLDRSGAVHVFQSDGISAWTEVPGPGLTADNTEALDLFGFAVAVRGARVVAAASLGDQGGNAAGAVHSFACDAAGCAQEAEAVASDEAPDTRFGFAVDVSGNTLVIGALRGDLEGAAPGGAVYVYRRAGQGWRQQAKLTSPVAEDGDAFGAAVAVEGNFLVVGAPRADRRDEIVSPPTSIADAGAVYVFRRENGRWIAVVRLQIVNPVPNLRLGSAVAIHQKTIAFSAPAHPGLPSPGLVYVVEHEDETWPQRVPPIVAPGLPLGSGFGSAIALEQDVLAVGAPFADGSTGKVYVFERAGSDLNRSPATIPMPEVDPEVNPGDLFGAAVALQGDTLAVGAPANGFTPGSAYVFRRSGPTWVLEDGLFGEADGDDVCFGVSLDLHEGALVAAAVEPGGFAGNDCLGQPILESPSDEQNGEPEEPVAAKASLFVRSAGDWPRVDTVEVTGVPPVAGPHRIKVAVSVSALDGSFFALTAPGERLGDRAGVFRFTGEAGPP